MPALNGPQRRVLAALCDTFQPPTSPGDGTGRPLQDRVLALLDLLHPDDFGLLKLVLATLGSSLANGALTGHWGSFDELPATARIAVLRDWGESRIEQRRAAFQALKRLVNVAYYAWPTANGSHPAWEAAGYPGPLPMPAAPAAPLDVHDVTLPATIECDVVVVGSGAGGGVVAGTLAGAGLSVVVLEKGANLGPADFTQIEGDMLASAYLDSGLCITRSGSLPILAGSCVGGGTTVNWTTSFAIPGAVRAEWDRVSGLGLFNTPRFADSQARVLEASGVNTGNSEPGPRDQVLERGLRALGWHVDVAPRNAAGCPSGAECGFCGYGCRHGAKQATTQTWLRGAVARGARVVPGCDARTIRVNHGVATGVDAVMANGAPLAVRASRVVVCAGALHTPALLARSGLVNRNIGRRLFLHPVTGVIGTFDERIEPWTGRLQTRYSDHFADLHEGYGAKLETGPIHFALPASAFGWTGPDQHRADVQGLAHQAVLGVLLRDREPGCVRVSRDGRPLPEYELSAYDAKHLRQAMRGVAEILAAAGAKEIVSLQQPPARQKPGASGWLDDWTRQLDARGLDRCRMGLFSFHQMGTVPLGADPVRGAADERGESFEIGGVYVADASCFPASSGVNPMIGIMAIADHVARGIVDAL